MVENLRIVMCDTNQEELEGYAKICRAICEDKQIKAAITTFSTGGSLLFEMSDRSFSSKVNILILEPDDGCESVAAAVREAGYDGALLYLSRSSNKRLYQQAFDVKAVNFVDKGDLPRFKKVFEDALSTAKQIDRQYIAVSCAGEHRQIDINDIYYFETTLDHMVCVWYAGGKFIFKASLGGLEERLKDRGFFRVHRSYLVSLDAIHRISREEVTLNNGMPIPVGRDTYPALKETMERWR